MTAPGRYRIPGGVHRVEEDVKNSRFITTVNAAVTEPQAREFVASVRGEFPDATHHCWAYLVGPPGSTRRIGSSDGGEPPGTAGRPMLTVLLNSGIGDVVVVVTRYFGGVKLGRGGLARAYAGGVKRVLREMPTGEHVDFVALEIRADYSCVDAVKKLTAAHGGVIEEESFAADAGFLVRVPRERLESLATSVLDATGGKAKVKKRDL